MSFDDESVARTTALGEAISIARSGVGTFTALEAAINMFPLVAGEMSDELNRVHEESLKYKRRKSNLATLAFGKMSHELKALQLSDALIEECVIRHFLQKQTAYKAPGPEQVGSPFLSAIRLYRGLTVTSLTDSKHAVEAMLTKNKLRKV